MRPEELGVGSPPPGVDAKEERSVLAVCGNAVRTSENTEPVAATCHEMNEWGWSERGWSVPRVDLTERAGGELTF